eukprot:m.74708 g.74708  ORF g.74708 m.74708 type:complete len:419 (+) comp35911_c0_seq7:798-2054(+)
MSQYDCCMGSRKQCSIAISYEKCLVSPSDVAIRMYSHQETDEDEGNLSPQLPPSENVPKLLLPPSVGYTSLPVNFPSRQPISLSSGIPETRPATEPLPIARPPQILCGVSSCSGFQGGGEESLSLGSQVTAISSASKEDDLQDKTQKWEVEIERLQKVVKEKNAELDGVRRHLDAVEKDKASWKRETELLRSQTERWKEEIEVKMAEVEGNQVEIEHSKVERETLRKQLTETEERAMQLERELNRVVAENNKLYKESEEHKATIQSLQQRGSGGSRPAASRVASAYDSYPQLVFGDPDKRSRQPFNPAVNQSEKFPQIVWHHKEETPRADANLPRNPTGSTLAEDQYAPLQAWLKKQKMKEAFSGAYAVPSAPAGLLSRAGKKVSEEETRYLDCPKCDKPFDARDFSSYRRHLEECLK